MPSGHRPQPPVGTARVAISGVGAANNPWVNVLWLQLTATTHVAADLLNIVDSMVTSFNTNIFHYMSSTAEITGVKASWIYAAGNVVEVRDTFTTAGGAAGAIASDAAAAVIDWSISDYYRGGHPRSYIAGVRSTDIVNSRNLASSLQSNLATGAQAFITAVNALTHGGISAATLGTVRFASGNAWLSPPVFKPYNGASVRAVLGTQRRRYAAN